MPDENIWHYPEALDEHFKAVEARRKSGMQPIDEGEDVPMTQNALLDQYRD